MTAENQLQADVLAVANKLTDLSRDCEMVNGYIERKLIEFQVELRRAVRQARGLKP